MTESRSEDDDIEFDEQNIADDNESSNGDPESPTAEAVAKAFLGAKYLVFCLLIPSKRDKDILVLLS